MTLFSCVVFARCNVIVRCEVFWDLVRCSATDDELFSKLPPSSRRKLCRCLMLPVIAKFDDGQKEVYIQLVILTILLLQIKHFFVEEWLFGDFI